MDKTLRMRNVMPDLVLNGHHGESGPLARLHVVRVKLKEDARVYPTMPRVLGRTLWRKNVRLRQVHALVGLRGDLGPLARPRVVQENRHVRDHVRHVRKLEDLD